MNTQQKINYSKMLEAEIEKIRQSGRRPKLLLHCCCAPCSSYVLEYLAGVFDITAYFYNPNISPAEEYDKRAAELARLIGEMPLGGAVQCVVEPYDNDAFERAIRGHEADPEGGARCAVCYRLRMKAAAQYAAEHGFDCFCTTLSISPLKNSQVLNRIGGEIADECGVDYLYSDFKKKEGYKRSIELSRQYSLYRQNYCGCVYSAAAGDKR